MDVDDVRTRLDVVRARIEGIERPWTHRVSVVGVTKGFGPETVSLAVAGGCDAIGENYAQELLDKRVTIESLRPDVHFIGRLQRNKVRQLVGLVDLWCSLDRASVVDEVAKRAPTAAVLIQVDTTGDPAKGGCDVDQVAELVDRARGTRVDRARVDDRRSHRGWHRGARPGFRLVRSLVDQLGLDVCSMGMSADLDVAVAEGSTEVRIGTALFGARPPRRVAPS